MTNSKGSSAVVTQVVDDRALNEFLQTERPIAFGDGALKGSAKRLQFPNARFEISQMLFNYRAHVPALLASLSVRRCEELPDFAERQAELLRPSDELNALDRVGRVQAEPGTRARRCRQKAQPLVIAHRIRRQAGGGGDRTGLMCLRHLSIPGVRVTRSLDEIMQSGVGFRIKLRPSTSLSTLFTWNRNIRDDLGDILLWVVVQP